MSISKNIQKVNNKTKNATDVKEEKSIIKKNVLIFSSVMELDFYLYCDAKYSSKKHVALNLLHP